LYIQFTKTKRLQENKDGYKISSGPGLRQLYVFDIIGRLSCHVLNYFPRHKVTYKIWNVFLTYTDLCTCVSPRAKHSHSCLLTYLHSICSNALLTQSIFVTNSPIFVLLFLDKCFIFVLYSYIYGAPFSRGISALHNYINLNVDCRWH